MDATIEILGDVAEVEVLEHSVLDAAVSDGWREGGAGVATPVRLAVTRHREIVKRGLRGPTLGTDYVWSAGVVPMRAGRPHLDGGLLTGAEITRPTREEAIAAAMAWAAERMAVFREEILAGYHSDIPLAAVDAGVSS